MPHGRLAVGLSAMLVTWIIPKMFGYSRMETLVKQLIVPMLFNASLTLIRSSSWEYPGYGNREGSPSKASFNFAAEEAYRWLRMAYPNIPVCIVGESIGSGPASSLTGLEKPPDKLVLVVPFDNLASVAREHFPLIPAGLVLFDSWDNVEAMKGYSGKLEIYGAIDDRVIPIHHARALAKSLPIAVFHEIPGGHNDWSQSGMVKIRN